MIKEFKGKYRFLSNFWPVNIEYEDILYPSVEHAFQACKTLNRKERLFICQQPTPAQAKKAGRRVTLRPNWNLIKVPLMHELLYRKFAISELKKLLLQTGDKCLQEGNYWHDTFWGVSLKTGKGRNVLGSLLISIRQEYINK